MRLRFENKVPSLTSFHRIFRGTLDWVATVALSVWQTADSINEVLEAYRTIKRDFRKSDRPVSDGPGTVGWNLTSFHVFRIDNIVWASDASDMLLLGGMAGKNIRYVCERDNNQTLWSIWTQFCKQVLGRKISVEFGYELLVLTKIVAVLNI